MKITICIHATGNDMEAAEAIADAMEKAGIRAGAHDLMIELLEQEKP